MPPFAIVFRRAAVRTEAATAQTHGTILAVSWAYDLADRGLTWLVTRVPGWVIVLIGLAFYPVLGLLLPLALHWSLVWLVEVNALGVVLAAAVSLGWLTAQVEAARRRHLVEWTTNLRLLNAEEFEWLVGETFRRQGWSVRETGRQGAPDGNVDLRLARDGRQVIVQCKRWTAAQVGVDEIREFGGTLLRERRPGRDGIFVTLSDLNSAAIDEAKKLGIEWINGAQLYERMEKVRKSEPCDICGQPMLLDRSQRGWWFRCITPGCRGKKDLATEPGRAVELLTQ